MKHQQTLRITKTLFLKAPATRVWTFLTDPDRLAEWFHRGAGIMEKGGDYALLTNSLGKEGEKMCWGKVLEFDPPNKLVHTFTHDWLKNGDDHVETTVTWILTEQEGGTVLSLIHEGWEKLEDDAFGMGANHDVGWDEHFTRLRRVVA